MAVLRSLNMAVMGRILPTLDDDQHKLAIAGGLLLFVVFGIKAAMLPVGFWLPKTCAVASTPVAAIFTIMTKVGFTPSCASTVQCLTMPWHKAFLRTPYC
ncbi:MAG: proton-conducting transporter membrane subunit [Acinetobacter sp.]